MLVSVIVNVIAGNECRVLARGGGILLFRVTRRQSDTKRSQHEQGYARAEFAPQIASVIMGKIIFDCPLSLVFAFIYSMPESRIIRPVDAVASHRLRRVFQLSHTYIK